jgi:hypothetical protein
VVAARDAGHPEEAGVGAARGLTHDALCEDHHELAAILEGYLDPLSDEAVHAGRVDAATEA